MTIIRNDRGKEFGGFTKAHWDSNSGYKNDNEAFLFSLTSNQKFLHNKKGAAIYCGSGYGPCFGNGHEIGFSGYFDKNDGGYSQVTGSSYFDVPGGAEVLVGCQNRVGFRCVEIEVYSIVFR